MKILTQIIETTKEEMKTFFKDRCQSKIEKFEKAKLKHKLHHCSHCNKEHLYILRDFAKNSLPKIKYFKYNV